MDPVCFLTCYPQLLHSFVYKVPSLAELLGSAAGALNAARFLFSRDLVIAEVCSHSVSCLDAFILAIAVQMGCATETMYIPLHVPFSHK